MVKCWKVNLSTGYCGTDEITYIKCEKEDLKENFDSMVRDHTESYEHIAHFSSVEEIMENEGCSEEEALEIADQEEENFYDGAYENSGYEECSEKEWIENNGVEW